MLPFADDFFDAIVSIDSFFYYGTDDHYLNYLARFVKPDGPIAIAGAGLMQGDRGFGSRTSRRLVDADVWAFIPPPGGSGIGNAPGSSM